MRNLIRIARALLALVPVAACPGRGENVSSRSGRAISESAAASVPAPTAAYSLYDLGSTWRDQHGTKRTLASLRGRPQLLSLVYTSCTSICPFTVATIQRVEQQVGDRAGYVLVSMDPGRDSPGRLAAYAAEHRLSSRWMLFSGPEGSVRELAALIGVKYRRVASGEIDHSSTLTVLDADGRVVAQFDQADAVDRAAAVLMRFPASPGHQP